MSLLRALSRRVNAMEVVVTLVALTLLAASAAADPFRNEPAISPSLPDIRMGEFWNPRRQRPGFGSIAPSQSGGKRSVVQPADAQTDNDFYKPIAEGFQTSLVQLRPVYVSVPDDGVDAKGNLGSSNTQKTVNSDDQIRNQRVRGAQKTTVQNQKNLPNLKTFLKSQAQKNIPQNLSFSLRPPAAQQNSAPRKKPESANPVIQPDINKASAPGTQNSELQGVFAFDPSQLLRKTVFPPEAFLPRHPLRESNRSQIGVPPSRPFDFGSLRNTRFNGGVTSIPHFRPHPFQGRELRPKKKSVALVKSKFNPSTQTGTNFQKSSKPIRPGQISSSPGSNLRFKNIQQFTFRPGNDGSGRVTRKLPGSFRENAKTTTTAVPKRISLPNKAGQNLKQSVNNVTEDTASEFNSQTDDVWEGVVLSEISKWASFGEETPANNETSDKLIVTKSKPTRKFVILDDPSQKTETTTNPPSTQQKRSEPPLTEVHHLKPVRSPIRNFAPQLENSDTTQQTAVPSRNLQNTAFQSRMLALESNVRDSEYVLQSYGTSHGSFPRPTRSDPERSRFAIDDSFLKQLSRQGNSLKTGSQNLDKLREVLATPFDTSNLSHLNALDESQKVALLQSIHQTSEEQAPQNPVRAAGLNKSPPASSIGAERERLKSDPNIIKQLNGKHLLGIQQIVGFKHSPSSSVQEVPYSLYFSPKKNLQAIHPTKFSNPQQFLSSARKPDFKEESSFPLALDEESLALRPQLRSQFPLNQLITQDFQPQISAQDQSLQSLPYRSQQAQSLPRLNFGRSPPNGKDVFDQASQKLESPDALFQNTSPRVSPRELSQQSALHNLSPQTSVELNQQIPPSKSVQGTQQSLPPRPERKAKDNLDIIQLEAVKLASKEQYYPRLPLEAHSGLRNSLPAQQDFEFPVSISAIKDGSSASLGPEQGDFISDSAPDGKTLSQAAEPEASDLIPVLSSEVNTHSFAAAQNIEKNPEHLQDEQQVLNPDISLQRQGAFHRPRFPGKKHQFRQAPFLRSPLGRDFVRVAAPPSFLGDTFPKSLQKDALQGENLKRFPDIRQLISDHSGGDARSSSEILIDEDEPNFNQQIVKAPPTFRVPQPITTKGSDFRPNEVEQLGPVDEPQFTDYEDIAERERPSLKQSIYPYYEREPKFFPKNGYNIAPFFRGFPSFGYFDKPT